MGTDPSGTPDYAQMSCDGSFVVFSYTGGAITSPSDASGTYVYLVDRRVGNKVDNVTSAWGASGSATISCNGDYIGFVNNYNNVDPNQPSAGANAHAYVYDRIDGSYHMVDQSTSGNVGNDNIATEGTNSCNSWPSGWSLTTFCMQVSDNGIATFSSDATNLVASPPSDTNVYVRNINTGETDLVTQTSNANITYTPVGISSDGKTIVYNSNDNDLVSGGTDTNSASDAFLHQTGF